MLIKEIDLHDMDYETALKVFINKYNSLYKSGYIREIRVIHGYGAGTLLGKGVIREKIRGYFSRNTEYLKYRVDLNPGVTYVTPFGLLPLKKGRKK
ncbi:MAG: Smr/MutS family protein [Fusobacteriaceae bacterium]